MTLPMQLATHCTQAAAAAAAATPNAQQQHEGG